MSNDIEKTWSAEDDTALRRRNRNTVEKFMRTGREDRLQRYTLYTDNGSAGLWLTDIGRPIVVQGKENLRAHGELSLKVLPDWQWSDVQVFATQDPNQFWVECGGEGEIRFPGYPVGHYRNHFVHSFRLDDGRIVQSREFTNPIEHMRALGIATPKIERDWIPSHD